MAVAERVFSMFDGFACAVRTIDPRTGRLTAAVARGRLAASRREAIQLSRSALERVGAGGIELPPNVRVSDRSGRLFAGTRPGFSVPLVAEGRLVGVIDVEPRRESRQVPAARRLLEKAAPALAVALRAVRELGELRANERRHEELLDRANALVLVTDGRRRIRVFNEAFCRLSGFPRHQVIGVDLLDLVGHSDRKSMLRAVAAALRGRSIDRVELGLVTAAGSEARVAMSTATLVAPDGSVEGVIAIGHDLTRLRELERRFWQAEKLASIGKLATGIAHELSNPLTIISMSAEALSGRTAFGSNEEERELLGKITEASGRLQRFSRELLAYARPAPTQTEIVDAGELVQKAVEYCTIPIRQSGALVSVSLEGDLPKIRGIRANLIQVLVNLVTNACQAVEGGGSVQLSAERRSGQLVLRVEDDGQGISPELRERIFEPFFTTKRPGQGTGLGLAIVQGIVTSHGGAVDVESVTPHGTRFTVTLPGE